MHRPLPRSLRAVWRASLLPWLVVAGGCSAFVFHADKGSEDEPPPRVEDEGTLVSAAAGRDGEPHAAAHAETMPSDDVRAAASRPRASAPSRPAGPPPERKPRVVVLSSAVPAHAELRARLEETLGAAGYDAQPIDLDAGDAGERLAKLHGQAALLAVAVGYEAALAARDTLAVPTIFCQVFNHHALDDRNAPLWGIAAIPPVELQLRAWKRLSPSLARIGTIIGPDHARLIREAQHAAKQAGIALRIAVSSSDRETLYHFRRFVHDVDGFWLFPDNRILSPAALRDITALAAEHDVEIVAVNALLPPGAAVLRVSGTTDDIVAAVRGVVEHVAAGATHDLPAITPLSEILVEVDAHAAARLGLDIPQEASWVVRE